MQGKQIRKRWFKIRVTEAELKVIKNFSTKTACKGASEYARNVLLKEPVLVLQRNQ